MIKVEHSFAPLFNEQTKILILGSFPSIVSREKAFYYMNPYNRFYKVLSVLLLEDLYECDILEKQQILLKYNIGLYDVIKSCTIKGSSDSSIRDIIVNDLEKIITETKITKIILNGGLAYRLFCKYFPQLQEYAIRLPSTSSANAKYSLLKLVDEWKVILDY